MPDNAVLAGPFFFVAPIDDNATPAGLALTQYNIVSASTAFTGEQKDVLNALIACTTGYAPAGHENPVTPAKDAEGNVPKGVTNGKSKGEAKGANTKGKAEDPTANTATGDKK